MRDLKFNFTEQKYDLLVVMIECIELLNVHSETQISKLRFALDKLKPNEEFIKNKRQKF